MNPLQPSLLPHLKQYFGFPSFRSLQEEIIRDSLASKDVFALLPTGGGKSLCFQLPALLRPGLTLVISPLISLMKDQVDALQASGIAATFLNSSLPPEESRQRIRELHNGRHRLLYVAPERAVLSGFLSDMTNCRVNLIAVDEAHCISEWGHDFRPEYRQLIELRKALPGVPMMALTATATKRVRDDIVKYLQLKTPSCFVASFNRPNLSYRVLPKSDPYRQLLRFLLARQKESGIVYCQSRKMTESLSERLSLDSISAAPYHAGMEPAERTKHQELFQRDEIHVMCATIAFGMGINKSNLRFVVHYDLPKNIEGYYQETGRAGRDGLPSECLLLFSRGDVVKQLHFIDEKEDEHERRIGRAQLEQMVHYAESGECRRAQLLEYFGERFPHQTCDACDNCLMPRETYDGTIEAQKLLSCVYRIKEKSGFNVGLRYVAEVLTGGDTEKIRRWNHTDLSTYGIGKERSREQWMAIGRELMRLRLLRQNDGSGFAVVETTPSGLEALKRRQTVLLTKPVKTEEALKARGAEQEYDEVLFECLRTLRKRAADSRNVAAFIVFSDVALRQMAQQYPTTTAEFMRVSGVGEKKLKDFGKMFMDEIAGYLRTTPRKEFATMKAIQPSPQSMAGKRVHQVGERLHASHGVNKTTRESLSLFRSGNSVATIARVRNLQVGTIYTHLLAALNAGEEIDLDRLVSAEERREISVAFGELGYGNLTGVFEMLGERFSYGVLRIVREVEHQKGPRVNV